MRGDEISAAGSYRYRDNPEDDGRIVVVAIGDCGWVAQFVDVDDDDDIGDWLVVSDMTGDFDGPMRKYIAPEHLPHKKK